jgi:hypothetical protein
LAKGKTMQEVIKTTEWTVEHQRKMLRFRDFESALAYADGAMSTKHLLKVIEPEHNNIVVVAEEYQANA